MKFIEVKIYTSHQGIEPLTAMLMEKGINGAVVDDPQDAEELLDKKNAYEWDYIDRSLLENQGKEPVVSVFFEDNREGRGQVRALSDSIAELKEMAEAGAFGAEADLGRLQMEEQVVDDGDWKDKWKEYFKPAKVTETLVVKPSWETYEKTGSEKVIELDPGMAFGTGTHETTTMCMELMEHYLKEGQSVLDIGCGSGILSIAAAFLGSGRVLGIEIDPDAVRTARENVSANGVSESVEIREGDLTKDVEETADLIAANLIAPLVIQLAEPAAEHLNADGVFISSGILTERKEEVEKAIREAGFEILEIREKGEWCAIAARK